MCVRVYVYTVGGLDSLIIIIFVYNEISRPFFTSVYSTCLDFLVYR